MKKVPGIVHCTEVLSVVPPLSFKTSPALPLDLKQRERETDRQTERQRDRETEIETEVV
jgi:hypothetical protein